MMKLGYLSTKALLLVTLLASGAVAAFAGPSGCASVAVGCGSDSDGNSIPCPDTSGVASSKLIHELTDTDRESWCGWYVANLPAHLGQAQPNMTPFPDGHVNVPSMGVFVPASASGGDLATQRTAEVCIFSLTVEECQQSLAVQPCTATVQQLDDCYRSALAEGKQLFGQGCKALRAAASCDGTVLGLGHATDPAPGDQFTDAVSDSAWCFARVH